METEFDFKGEDEEVSVPHVAAPDNLRFKTLNRAKTENDQVNFATFGQFLIIKHAKLPDNIKELFNLKKAGKSQEDESIEYVNFDKSTHPNLHKYSKKVKIRKVEANVLNLYDISMKSLLTSAEISKRAELMAKLYMKLHYDEDKYNKAMEQEKNRQKKAERINLINKTKRMQSQDKAIF